MGTLDQRTTSSLASEFPVPSLEEWRAAAARELGGADPETLRRIVLGDLPVEPLYARPAAVTRHGRAAAGPWLVEQEIRLGDPQAANRAIRDGLARGQTALRLLIEDDLTLEGLQTALAEVEPAAQPLSIEAGAAGGPALALLAALAEERNVPLEALEGAVGGDPLAELARTGRLAHPLEAAWDALAEATDWAQRRAPSIRTALIDGRPYDEAGASAVEELACVIAAAAETLRAMVARGVEPDRAVDAFAFSLAVSSDAPLEIAKLRAARSLWQLTARAFGGAAAVRPMALHVSTGLRDLTRVEPKNNLVRTAVQAFAAAVGGCDSLSVTPFDAPLGLPSALAERLARNQQLLLLEEASVGRVADPAGGSGAIEALTEQIARRSWERVQEIEAAGGLWALLRDGSIQERLAADAARRAAEARVVGVTLFREAAEASLPRDLAGTGGAGPEPARPSVGAGEAGDFSALVTAARHGASTADLLRTLEGAGPEVRVRPLTIARTAAAFEEGST